MSDFDFSSLSEQEQEVYFDLARELLADLLWCTRCWSAWSYGTMTQDDFRNAANDDDIVQDTASRLAEFCTQRKG